jgi:DNA-binding response OmpR family regulator
MPSILAIDDDKEYRPFLKRYLTKLGFDTTVARSGDEGLEWCRKARPDLILLDWCLTEGVSGRETLRLIKNQPATRDIPVIVISGINEDAKDEVDARAAGAAHFFTKNEISDSVAQAESFRRHLIATMVLREGAVLTRRSATPRPRKRPRVQGRVLMIDDDEEMRGMVSFFLESKGCTMLTAARASEGLARAQQESPDLVILDLGLPDMDGLEVCAQLKGQQKTRPIPLLILTSRSSTQARLLAVEYGADHYFTKPIRDLDDFHNWVGALLRRRSHFEVPKHVVRVGDALLIDTVEHTVTVGGRLIKETPATLFRLLCEFARHPGEVLSREYLLHHVWGDGVRLHNVATAVSRLKQYLGAPVDAWIVTVPGVGFRFMPASGIGEKETIRDA